LNANNPAVTLPVEILHVIFLCTKDSYVHNPSFTEEGPRYPPNWVAITYVCRRWRAVALDFRKLWSTITPDLSPKWLSTSLQRSSYDPKHVYIAVGPPSTKPRENRLSRINGRPVPIQYPPTTIPPEVTEEILSHRTRIENLQLRGNTVDVIRTLKSLGESMALTSLSLGFWDEHNYRCVNCGGGNERQDTSPILPESLFGGRAPRLCRLSFRSTPHLTFPPWVLRSVSEFTVSHTLCANHLLPTLSQMPQLEVLRVQGLWVPLHSGGVNMPVKLNNLALLIVEDGSPLQTFLGLFSCLLVPANVRKNLKLTVEQSELNTNLWERFTSLVHEKTEGSLHPFHGVYFKREFGSISLRAWASPTKPGRSPSPWELLEDPFRLDIRITGVDYLHSRYRNGCHTTTSFRQLQQLCTVLGSTAVQELFIECQVPLPYNPYQSMVLCHCWPFLFSCFPSLKTLRFGEGAASLLATASFAASAYPSNTADGRGILFESIERVIVSRSKFSVEALWRWVHYAFARPSGWDVSDLRKNVSALLLAFCQNPEVGVGEGVTECLLMFILYCRRLDVQVFEVSLVEPLWDKPGGLEVLERLLHMLDPDWNVICYPSD